MARRTTKKKGKTLIESHDHQDKKRANNPPAGLVTPDTDPDETVMSVAAAPKDLKAELDEELIEAYRGTVSLPFEPGDHQRVAVKIIDDREIESLKIVEVGA